MANSNSKVTRSQALAMAIEGKTLSAEAIATLTALKESIDKKTSDNSKAKAQAKASRDVVADKVFAYMTTNGGKYTISELIKTLKLEESTSKVTSSLRLDGRFGSEKTSKSSLYFIA